MTRATAYDRCQACDDSIVYQWPDGIIDTLCEECLREAGIFDMIYDEDDDG